MFKTVESIQWVLQANKHTCAHTHTHTHTHTYLYTLINKDQDILALSNHADVKNAGKTFLEDLNEISVLINCSKFVKEMLSVINLFVNFPLMEQK